jgi:maltose/moltooligosaccharide transporter
MQKKQLSFWQIWNMSFGFLGIQFGWGLQMANMSPIYKSLGASPDEIPILWLAAPLTGLIVQPIIGHLSDNTWNGLGRRKPFFLIGAILSSICLILMPNSSTLWMAAGLLWILDSSINISMEPFRAFVADMLPEEQRTQGFTMQSFFIGVGTVIASALPFLLTKMGVTDTSTTGISTAVQISFYAGAAAFFGAVLYTILTTKEYPPADMEAFEAKKKEGLNIAKGAEEIFSSLMNMPKVMKQLAIVQVFTWLGMFFMWMFFGNGIMKTVFADLQPNTPEYVSASQWGGMCFSFYSLVTFAVAFLLPELAKRTSRKMTHAICLIMGGLGLLSVGIIGNQYLLLASMAGVGIAWASILSMPYAILSNHLPEGKIGIYMGIFNFFIVLPEICASLFFGKIMKYVLNNNEIMAVVLGGVSMLIAAALTLRVEDNEVSSQVKN